MNENIEISEKKIWTTSRIKCGLSESEPVFEYIYDDEKKKWVLNECEISEYHTIEELNTKEEVIEECKKFVENCERSYDI